MYIINVHLPSLFCMLFIIFLGMVCKAEMKDMSIQCELVTMEPLFPWCSMQQHSDCDSDVYSTSSDIIWENSSGHEEDL